MSKLLLSLISFLSFQNQPMYVMSEVENIYTNQEKTLKITTLDCKEKVYIDLAYITYYDQWNSIKQIVFSNGVTCQIDKIEDMTIFQG